MSELTVAYRPVWYVEPNGKRHGPFVEQADVQPLLDRLAAAEAKVRAVEALIEEREAWARAKTAELKARWADRPEPVRRRYGISAVYGTAELRAALTEEA